MNKHLQIPMWISSRPHAARRMSSGAVRSVAPQRLCVVCRQVQPVERLVSLRGVPSEEEGCFSRGGRRSYVCIASACLKDLQGKILSRSLKKPVRKIDADVLKDQLHTLAHNRLVALIGLARRQGQLVWGVASVADSQVKIPGLWCVVAADLAERSCRKLAAVPYFLNAEKLGQVAGLQAVGAVGIRPGRLAQQAAYWLTVWYETSSWATTFHLASHEAKK